MKNFYVSKSRRLRSTLTSELRSKKPHTVYNHMLLPTTFSTPEEDIHLKEHVYPDSQRERNCMKRPYKNSTTYDLQRSSKSKVENVITL